MAEGLRIGGSTRSRAPRSAPRGGLFMHPGSGRARGGAVGHTSRLHNERVESRTGDSRRPITLEERAHVKALGAALREARVACGLSVRSVAAASEVSWRHLYRLELGER